MHTRVISVFVRDRTGLIAERVWSSLTEAAQAGISET